MPFREALTVTITSATTATIEDVYQTSLGQPDRTSSTLVTSGTDFTLTGTCAPYNDLATAPALYTATDSQLALTFSGDCGTQTEVYTRQ
jgi:hypothetical protein